MPPRSNNNGRDSRSQLGSQEQPRNVFQRLSNLEKNTLTNRGGARTAGSTPSRICPRLCVPVEIVAEGKERRAILEIWDDINAYSDPDHNFPFFRVLEANADTSERPAMILREGPYILTDHNDNPKFAFYYDPPSQESVTLDFSGIDAATGSAYIMGPNFQIIQIDHLGTQIYDNLVLGSTSAETADQSINLGWQACIIPFDCSGGDLVCTLPQIAGGAARGTIYLISKSDDSANTLTIQPFSGENINGGSTPVVLTSRGYALAICQNNSSFVNYWEVHALGGGGASATSFGPISDRFNRATSTTGVGTADTGQPWSPIEGVMGIGSNRANVQSLSVSNRARSLAKAGFADVAVSAVLHDNPSGTQVWFRSVADGSSGLLLETTSTSYKLRSFASGTFTDLHDYGADTPLPASAGSDQVTVILKGSTISLIVNGVRYKDVSSGTNADEVWYGVGGNNTTVPTFDNFSVVPLDPESEKTVDWNFPASDCNTTGHKHAYWHVPFDCKISRVSMYDPGDPSTAPANFTMTANLWRGTKDGVLVTWDASALNPSAFGPTAATGYTVTSYTSWTISLSKGDVLAWEFVTADASVSQVWLLVEVQPL